MKVGVVVVIVVVTLCSVLLSQFNQEQTEEDEAGRENDKNKAVQAFQCRISAQISRAE